MHIKSELMQVSKARFFAQLASTLLTNCRQELEETAQESVNRDYHQGKEALGKILTEEQMAALEEAEGLYGQLIRQEEIAQHGPGLVGHGAGLFVVNRIAGHV